MLKLLGRKIKSGGKMKAVIKVEIPQDVLDILKIAFKCEKYEELAPILKEIVSTSTDLKDEEITESNFSIEFVEE